MNRSNQLATAASNAAGAVTGGLTSLGGMIDGGPQKAPAVKPDAAMQHVDTPDINTPATGAIPEEWRMFQHDPHGVYYRNFA